MVTRGGDAEIDPRRSGSRGARLLTRRPTAPPRYGSTGRPMSSSPTVGSCRFARWARTTWLAVRALLDGLTPQSLRMRFFSPRAPSDVELAKMLDVDYRDRFTLGVEMAGELIGMGSYYYDSEQASAEVAFTVADAHHAQGIGTLLLEHLVAAALSNGIQRFDAQTLGDNRQMLDVFRHAGFAVRRSLDARGVRPRVRPVGPGRRSRRRAGADRRDPIRRPAPRPEGGRGDRCQPHRWDCRQRGAGQHLRERLRGDRAPGEPARRKRPGAEVLPVDRRRARPCRPRHHQRARRRGRRCARRVWRGGRARSGHPVRRVRGGRRRRPRPPKPRSSGWRGDTACA